MMRAYPGITPHPRGGWRVVASSGSGAERRRLVRIVRGTHNDALAVLVDLRRELDAAAELDAAPSLVRRPRRP